MDQLKEKLAVAVRHGFWIVSGVVLIGALAVWYLATNRLATENEEQTRKLEQDIQAVRTVSSELPTHPNEMSHARMEELIEARTEEVLAAWEQVYTRQSDILTWPNQLGQDFVNEFKDLIPIELHVDFPPTPEQAKKTDLLVRYEQYISGTLPKIASIAKTKWTASVAGSSFAEENDSDSDDDEGPLVEWPTASQQAVVDDLFPWLGSRPTTLEVYYSQENIWILKQLLQIIADVNGDAQQRFQAKIHQIELISLGQSVDFDSGEIAEPGQDRPSGGAGMGGYMEMEEGYGEGYGEGGGDYYSDMGGGGAYGDTGAVSADPADQRYVDINKEPISAADLRARLKSNSPEDATIAVAKRVPVMMSLQMDQRHVPRLLAACGSAPLMVEVGQVTILPQGQGVQVSGGGGAYGDQGMEMEEDGYGDEYGGGNEMEDPYGSQAAVIPTEPQEEFPLDVSVQVYGLIYIYNPPDLSKLGIEQVTEDVAIDGKSTTDAEPEAAVAGAEPSPAPAEEQPAAPATPQTPDASADPENAPAPADAASPEPTAPEPTNPDQPVPPDEAAEGNGSEGADDAEAPAEPAGEPPAATNPAASMPIPAAAP